MDKQDVSWQDKYPYCLLTKYFIQENGITEDTPYEVKEMSARELLVPERIDLMAKWLYITAVENNMDMQGLKQLYKRHIEAFSMGTFTEPGTDTKNTIEKYFEEFEEIISGIKTEGFNEDVSLVPMGRDNVILDGAHRCASAAYFDKKVTVIYFKDLYRDYGTDFFRKRLLDEEYLDQMVLQYCGLKENLFFACLWPAGNRELRERAIDVISDKCGKIVYQREIRLTYSAMRNFMIQIYGHQAWVGTVENRHAGVDEKVRNCYGDNPMTIVLFHCDSLDKVLETKQKIRDIYRIENHSVHITDNDEETRMLANILLNKNSLHLIKSGDLDYSGEVNALVKRVNAENAGIVDDVIVEPEGTKAIYGLAPVGGDIKVLTLAELAERADMQKLGKSAYDLLYNPQNYMVFNGVKFFSLENAKKWEKVTKSWNERISFQRIGYRIKFSLLNINVVQKIKGSLGRRRKRRYTEKKKFTVWAKEKIIRILEKLHLLNPALKVLHFIKRQ